MRRRQVLGLGVALAVLGGTGSVRAAGRDTVAQKVLDTWLRLTLELIRHTPTYTPPVASRTLAYLGIAAFEALVTGDPALRSLSGQLNGLPPLPDRAPGQPYDTAVILNAVLDPLVHAFFANTGPTGQHAMQTLTGRLADQSGADVAPDVVAASRSYGATLAAAILAWADGDGGAAVENLGFPRDWTLNPAPGHWKPTSRISLQQAPLLPDWGRNRTFAMPAGDSCALPPPTPYSEEPGSPFHDQALQVYSTAKSLTPEQTHIARFWSDDAMLSFTPPGHWTAVLGQIAAEQGLDLTTQVEALARMTVAMADAFIGCWAVKYQYDLLRPVTYIKAHIDKAWEPLLNTPPFPEYPSGHSTQSAAAAAVLTAQFGADFAFSDQSPTPDGVKPRSFASFDAAADEAAISRLYGGIHFMPAITQGQAQGRCIAAHAIALRTRA